MQIGDPHPTLERDLLARLEIAHHSQPAHALEAVEHSIADVVNVGVSVNASGEVVEPRELSDL